jgi:hypothetical protein
MISFRTGRAEKNFCGRGGFFYFISDSNHPRDRAKRFYGTNANGKENTFHFFWSWPTSAVSDYVHDSSQHPYSPIS